MCPFLAKDELIQIKHVSMCPSSRIFIPSNRNLVYKTLTNNYCAVLRKK